MIFDIEADGLLEEATVIHVLAYTDGTKIKHTHNYDEMREFFLNAATLAGHNIVCYDIPVVEKLLGIKIKARLIDTLPLSWYLYPNRIIHGLDSWGKDFGIKKPEIEDWKNLTQEEYAHRCVEDVKINKKLYQEQMRKLSRIYDNPSRENKLINYLAFKMRCAALQQESKWKADLDLIKSTITSLTKERDARWGELAKHMPPVEKYVDKNKPAKPFKKDGTLSVAGSQWASLLKEHNLPQDYEGPVRVLQSVSEPNPGSPAQVKDWLFSLGWVPKSFKFDKDSYGNERRIPQVRVDNEGVKELCPSVLELAEENEGVRALEGLSVVSHRLGIMEGFLRDVDKDGYLTANISGLTNTLRFKHKTIVNLPGVDKPYGDVVRGALIAGDGEVLCGSDMSSLEENTKKHYMFDHDPEYVEEMSKPGFDAHLDLAKFAGAIDQEQIDLFVLVKKQLRDEIEPDPIQAAVYKTVGSIRKVYKPANYACVYGVGAYKLHLTTGLPIKQCEELIKVYWQRNWAVKATVDTIKVKKVGDEMWLLNPVSKLWYSLRYKKDIFSTLNQGTGVYCFDRWIKYILDERPQLTGQFHDEIILSIKKGAEDKCRALLRRAIKKVNDELKLNVTLDVEIQFGNTYADIH